MAAARRRRGRADARRCTTSPPPRRSWSASSATSGPCPSFPAQLRALRTRRSARIAGREGRDPVVEELTRASRDAGAREHRAIILEYLDDRGHAVEEDPRSPGGKGYTGLEALLQYVFDQSQAINVFDQNGFLLKVNLFHSKCSDYQNPESLKEEMAKDPSFYKDCAAILGPNQPSDHDARPDLHGPPVRRGREEARRRRRRPRRSPRRTPRQA